MKKDRLTFVELWDSILRDQKELPLTLGVFRPNMPFFIVLFKFI